MVSNTTPRVQKVASLPTAEHVDLEAMLQNILIYKFSK